MTSKGRMQGNNLNLRNLRIILRPEAIYESLAVLRRPSGRLHLSVLGIRRIGNRLAVRVFAGSRTFAILASPSRNPKSKIRNLSINLVGREWAERVAAVALGSKKGVPLTSTEQGGVRYGVVRDAPVSLLCSIAKIVRQEWSDEIGDTEVLNCTLSILAVVVRPPVPAKGFPLRRSRGLPVLEEAVRRSRAPPT